MTTFPPHELPQFAGELTTVRTIEPRERMIRWLLKQDNRYRQTFCAFPGAGIIERRKRKINGSGTG